MVYAAVELKATKKKAWRARSSISPTNSRAGDEIRTRDIQLGKLTLYQLSYARLIHRPFVFWEHVGSKVVPKLSLTTPHFQSDVQGTLGGNYSTHRTGCLTAANHQPTTPKMGRLMAKDMTRPKATCRLDTCFMVVS